MITNEAGRIISDETLTGWRSMLFPYAYNLLGESLPAEDIIQEVLNSYVLNAEKEAINNVRGYLIRATINKAINYKNLLRVQKESYPGQWLPEPVATDSTVYDQVDRKYILNYSLLVLLENLKPAERAVFILKETFDFSHEEIAGTLSIKPDHSRQLLKRAKTKLQGNWTHNGINEHRRLLEKLHAAIMNRDIEALKSILAEDVSVVSDGGGKRPSARNILYGATKTARFLMGIWTKKPLDFQPVTLNRQPAMRIRLNGAQYSCCMLNVSNDRIQNVYIITHPDKLPGE